MNARIIAIAAAVLFATAAFAAKPDVIVLRDGETQGGTLRSCQPDSCTLGKTLYKREAMAWIGFAADNAKPPLGTYNSEDEIHLRDGSTYRGHLISVSDAKVEIEGASFDRDKV